MTRKLFATALAAILMISMLSMSVCAEPYTEIKIGPGKTTIEATDFDTGEGNYGKAPASGNKDIRPDEEVNTEYGGSGFIGNIGWIAAGDWVQYTVIVEQDGTYKIDAWLATDNDNCGGVKVYYDGNEIGTSPDVEKWGWQDYDLYTVGEVDMTAGTHILKVEFLGGLNFPALEISQPGAEPETTTEAPTEAPTTTEAAAEETTTVETATESEAVTESSTTDEGGSNTILFIILGVAVVIVIVVIIVLATRKKK